MCVGIALALTLLVLYYTDATLVELSLYEQLGDNSVMVAEGWSMMSSLWPVMLLGLAVGILLTLAFLKFKKIL